MTKIIFVSNNDYLVLIWDAMIMHPYDNAKKSMGWPAQKDFEDDGANSGLDEKDVLDFGFPICYMLKNFFHVNFNQWKFDNFRAKLIRAILEVNKKNKK